MLRSLGLMTVTVWDSTNELSLILWLLSQTLNFRTFSLEKTQLEWMYIFSVMGTKTFISVIEKNVVCSGINVFLGTQCVLSYSACDLKRQSTHLVLKEDLSLNSIIIAIGAAKINSRLIAFFNYTQCMWHNAIFSTFYPLCISPYLQYTEINLEIWKFIGSNTGKLQQKLIWNGRGNGSVVNITKI